MEKNFKVYKSSAGSGKTFTLVKEFLKICFSRPHSFGFAEILAITFTNKASVEMKDRIIRTLKELSETEGNHAMESVLLEELQLDSQNLKDKSNELLLNILHHYADFSISTIDKFTHKILRTFAKDLNLPINFQVEVDEGELLKNVIQQLIEQIGKDQPLSKMLFRFVSFKMQAEKSWKLEQELNSFSKNLLQDQHSHYLKAIRNKSNKQFKEFQTIYQESNQAFEKKMKILANEGMDLIQAEQIEKVSFSGNSTIIHFFERIINGEIQMPSNQLIRNIEKNNWHSAKCKADQKEAINRILDQLQRIFYEAFELLQENLKAYLSRKLILKNSHQMGLINQIDRQYTQLKEDEKILGISEFNRQIAKVVMKEPMPFIYERLGERYAHIMIDEFQDTSVLQFANLLPLIDEALSKGKKSMIVGDAKQAIYRFRGGEVDQFAEMPDYVPDEKENEDLTGMRMQSIKANYQVYNLSSNYRSATEIVEFNNAFFEFAKHQIDNPKIHKIFKNHQQRAEQSLKKGLVEIELFDEKNPPKPEMSLDDQYFQKIIEIIKQSLKDGYQLNEIGILCRKKKVVSKLADLLKKNQLNVISDEGLLLNEQAEVRFMINIMRWLALPENDLVKKEILSFLYHSEKVNAENYDALLRLIFQDNQSIEELISREIAPFSRLKFKDKPLYELGESLIRFFSLHRPYPVFLQAFLDQLYNFSQKKGVELPSFLIWWDENKDKPALSSPEKLDAVKVMTIHKSKGLEFPIVIYPFAEDTVKHSTSQSPNFLWVTPPEKPRIEIPYALVEFSETLLNSSLKEAYEKERVKQEVDLINLTYVAFSRAEERLYILSKKVKDPKNLGLPKLIEQFANQYDEHFSETYNLKIGNEKPQRKEKVSPKSENAVELEFISHSWESRLQIAIDLSDTNLKNSESRTYGLILHELLSKISSIEDIGSVLGQEELNGSINQDERKQFEQKLNSLLTNKAIAPFFQVNQKSKREVSIVSQGGKVLRPDRLVFLDHELAVIDFKTGTPLPEHEEQLLNYKSVLNTLSRQEVNAYIIYTEQEELVKV